MPSALKVSSQSRLVLCDTEHSNQNLLKLSEPMLLSLQLHDSFVKTHECPSSHHHVQAPIDELAASV